VPSGVAQMEAQFAEHFHVLFAMRGGLAHRLFAARRDVELVAECQPLTHFELDAAPRISRRETEHVPLDRTALADPPPITPRLPYFAMKSKARSELLWIGCQHPTGTGTSVISCPSPLANSDAR
jgi:hypothetical protein